MRLSSSLEKNIVEALKGNILNKSHGINRRDVLFFENIIGGYFHHIEEQGHGRELQDISQLWMNLVMGQQFRGLITRLPPEIFFNTVMARIWRLIGVVDEFKFARSGDTASINSKNEVIIRVIGGNRSPVGFYIGILNVIFDSEVECISAKQTKEKCAYTFRIYETPFTHPSRKGLQEYNQLNKTPEFQESSLKDVLAKKVFALDEKNAMYFRGKRICTFESTAYHIIGNRKILLDAVPRISHDFFEPLIDEDSTPKQKLTLLKTMLQAMGWGEVNFVVDDTGKIRAIIQNPPYGLQAEEDDWTFIAQAIAGYLKLINKDYTLTKQDKGYRKVTLVYET